MDDHYLSFGTVFLTILTLGISILGGGILVLTFRHWSQQKELQNQSAEVKSATEQAAGQDADQAAK